MSGFFQSQSRDAGRERNFVLGRARGSREEKDVAASYIVTGVMVAGARRLVRHG